MVGGCNYAIHPHLYNSLSTVRYTDRFNRHIVVKILQFAICWTWESHKNMFTVMPQFENHKYNNVEVIQQGMTRNNTLHDNNE